MRIVIDTNVYVSSLVFKGKAREAYDFSIANAEVFISDYIIAELSDKLHTKFSIRHGTIRKTIRSILSVVNKTSVNVPLPDVSRDPDDNYILQLCESVTADFLITGDKDLLVLKTYKSTIIITPADFLKLFV